MNQFKSDIVRRFQRLFTFLSDSDLAWLTTNNGVKKNPIIKRDVDIYADVLGPIKHGVPGETRNTLDPVGAHCQIASLPPTIKLCCNYVQLSEDTLRVDDVPFLASTLGHVHYVTTSAADNTKCENIELGLQNIFRCYIVRGFHIVLLMEDMRFKNLKHQNKAGISISIVSAGEHITQI